MSDPKPPTARDYGCGDNSCIFGAPGGMATNGGCRCIEKVMDRPQRQRVTRGVLALRDEIRRLQHLLSPRAVTGISESGGGEA